MKSLKYNRGCFLGLECINKPELKISTTSGSDSKNIDIRMTGWSLGYKILPVSTSFLLSIDLYCSLISFIRTALEYYNYPQNTGHCMIITQAMLHWN